MGVAEEGAARREAIDIRSLNLGMGIEAADPIVKIVNRDEENVGTLVFRMNKQRETEDRAQDRFPHKIWMIDISVLKA